MADFLVKAKDKAGTYLETEVTADSASTAAKFLINKGYFPITVSLKGQKESLFHQVLPFIGRISTKDKVIFVRQLATMINAGLPLVQSLHTLTAQTNNPKFQAVILKIASDVEAGQSMAKALANHPDVFNRLFLAMVKSGEDSGTLDKVLVRLADQLEKSYNLIAKIRNALFYPGFVVGMVLVIMVLLTIFVIPQFASFYESINAQLPLPTRIMLGLSKILINYWWIVLLVVVGALYALRRTLKTDEGRIGWDRIKLKLPIFKKLLLMVYMSRFTRTFGTLIGTGIPVLEAMSIVADSVNNEVYRQAILKAAVEVKRGTPLSDPLKANSDFPPLVSQMVAVGEQTGELDNILNKLADYYDNELDNLTKTLATLIEPILLVVVGILVFIFILTILLPGYNLVFQFAGGGGPGGVRI